MIPTKRRPKFLNLRAVPITVFPFQSRFRFIFMDHPGILPRTCTNTCGGLSGLSHKEDGIAIHQPSMFGSSQYKYIICFACLQLRSLLLQMYSDSFWAGFASGLFFLWTHLAWSAECPVQFFDQVASMKYTDAVWMMSSFLLQQRAGLVLDEGFLPAGPSGKKMLPNVLRKDDCSC